MPVDFDPDSHRCQREAHSRMRKRVNRGFTPRRIPAWEDRVRELASQGLDRLRTRGEFDLLEELAMSLPVTVVAEFPGIDGERTGDCKRWSDAIVQSRTGSGMQDFACGPGFDAMVELLVPGLVEGVRRCDGTASRGVAGRGGR